MREVKERVFTRGAGLQSVRGEGAWEVSQLLYNDDMALVAELREKLQKMVSATTFMYIFVLYWEGVLHSWSPISSTFSAIIPLESIHTICIN